MTDEPGPEQAVYDRLWSEARALFAAGQVKVDPYLRDRANDTRRGLSLIIRPGGDARPALETLLDELRALCPGQHIYRPDELHITALSLVSAAPGFDLDAVPLEAYRAFFSALLPQVPPFRVCLRGLTASPDCLLVCGSAERDALNALRDRLRRDLPLAGLPGTLDRRYRIVTAHLTALRFASVPPDLPRLIEFVESARARSFGSFDVAQLELVMNDWFMSVDRVRLLGRYTLGAANTS